MVLVLTQNRRSANFSYEGIHTGGVLEVIAHTMHHGDASVYYPHVIFLIRNLLTHTTDVMSVSKLGKMCDVM